MDLIKKIDDSIINLIYSHSLNHIRQERVLLSDAYRKKRGKAEKLNPLSSDQQRLAYLIARAPATRAAILQVLKRAAARWKGDLFTSFLDIGAGPGTALWAALEVFPLLTQATLLERDAEFIALGKKIIGFLEGVDLQWLKKDFSEDLEVKPHDLVIASYSLGEMAHGERINAIEKIFNLTNKILIIIEPGTPQGFSHILEIRECLISLGAHLLAPCPHALQCPIQKNDWCHFSARVERSAEHRKIKGGTLNYEDEKYSYLIFSKDETERCSVRVVRHPFRGSGYVKLKICSEQGLEDKLITKKNKDSYSVCRKLNWGDGFNNYNLPI